MSQAVSDETRVFVSAFAAGKDASINAYQLNLADGSLKLAHRNTEVEHPFFLAVSPDNKYLYSIHAPGKFGGTQEEQIAAFSIVNEQGELKLLNRQSSRGTASCYLDVDKTGKSLVVANYLTGSVASYRIQSDGSLSQSVTFMQHSGASIRKDRQSSPHAHCSVVSPDGRFMLSADLGIDKVMTYALDAGRSTLSPSSQVFAEVPSGSGPRHLTFHPNGKHVYVINELANSITAFDYETSTGRLTQGKTISTVPADFAGTSHCADLKITPNGKYLYGTNRGHDSIAVYRIVDGGRLELVDIEPSLGKGPQNLAITTSGQWLLCANMPGNNLVVFRIDDSTGKLSAAGQMTSITSPSCIMIR